MADRLSLTSEARAGHLAMLIFSILVAGSFALGSLVANEIDPAAFNAVRFVFATCAVGTVFMLRLSAVPGLWAAPWRYVFLGGLYATYFVAMFEGLKTAGPVSSAAVFTLTPAISAVFGWLMLRQVTTPRIALALAIGAAGALWIIFRADLAALLAMDIGRGESIFLLGCIAHAAYTPAVRWLSRGEPILAFTFATLLTATAILLVWGGPAILAYDWPAAPPLLWATLLYTAFAATSFTVFLVQFSSFRLPASKVMAYTYLVPFWVALWQVALGGPLPSTLVLAGVGLAAIALGLLIRD
ncbi:MAG: DMT family transporter [Pseudomonadota bacterium]